MVQSVADVGVIVTSVLDNTVQVVLVVSLRGGRVELLSEGRVLFEDFLAAVDI